MVSLVLLFCLLSDCDCDKNAFSVDMRSSNIVVLAMVLSLFGLFCAIRIPSVMAPMWVFVSNILLN